MSDRTDQRSAVHPDAFALRPLRIFEESDKLVHYEATTFPRNPWAGCELWLRRVDALFGLGKDGDGPIGPLGVDALAENGDILQTFGVNRKGFEYLRGKLRFRREPDE